MLQKYAPQILDLRDIKCSENSENSMVAVSSLKLPFLQLYSLIIPDCGLIQRFSVSFAIRVYNTRSSGFTKWNFRMPDHFCFGEASL